jgi:hypothetical protein
VVKRGAKHHVFGQEIFDTDYGLFFRIPILGIGGISAARKARLSGGEGEQFSQVEG